MHRISGTFPSQDIADKAAEALAAAGVSEGNIHLTPVNEDGRLTFVIDADPQTRDAAGAIVTQAGAIDVQSIDTSAETPDAEAVARFRDPAQPIIAPAPR